MNRMCRQARNTQGSAVKSTVWLVPACASRVDAFGVDLCHRTATVAATEATPALSVTTREKSRDRHVTEARISNIIRHRQREFMSHVLRFGNQ